MRQRVRLALILLVAILAAVATLATAADAVCPKCGAALEPGAAFCTACGHRLETPAPASAETRHPVAQVIATHDSELTSAFVAIVWGSKIEVDSLLGSTFAVAPGEFVTDAGLLIGAKSVALRTSGGRTVPARVVGIDPLIGVGLLSADLPDMPPLPRRDGLPRLGESMKSVGFPSGRRSGEAPAATQGVVSALGRGGVGFHPVEDYIQTDASHPDGFAGAPLVDSQGSVVGMSTGAIVWSRVEESVSTGIAVSIPLSWIDRALEWIRSGAPPRPWIGIHTVRADAETRALYGASPEAERIVTQVFPGSPAAVVVLKAGDGLLRVQGEEATSLSALQQRLLRAKPGDRIELEVVRDKTVLKVAVTLAPRPERPRLAGLDALRYHGGFDAEARGDSGIVVTRVLPGTRARAAKIASGDALQSVFIKKDLERADRGIARWRSVRSIQELEERLAAAYSDSDFFVGLRFRGKDGSKRELFLWDILVSSSAL
jgi:serine protease DegS